MNERPPVADDMQPMALAAADDDRSGEQPGDDDITVTGRRIDQGGQTGAKTDTPLIALPQTVTVIDNEELTVRNALSINQALGYVAGVAPNQRGNVATRYDQLFIRGFSPGVYMDGMRLLAGPYSGPQIDFHLVERVDVIKGPASVLYGNATPGGLVNLVSKTPFGEPGGRVEAAVGNFDLLRGAVDINQPLDAAGRWRVRVIGGGERSDGFLDFTRNERYYIRPMLGFAPDARTDVTLILNYQRDPQAAAYSGVPVFGSALPNPFGEFRTSLNVSEPDYEEFDRTQRSATLLFRRQLDDVFTWTTNARYIDVDLIYRQIYLSFAAQTGTGANRNTDFSRITRGGGGADERFRTLTIDNRLAARFATGPIGHNLIVGVDWLNNRGRNIQAFATGPSANPAINISDFDLFNPVYGVNLPSRDLALFPGVTRAQRRIDQVGVYVQDQLTWGGLNLIASGRWDWYEQLSRNLNITTVSQTALTRLKQDAFTGRLGALYEFGFGVSPFVSYSESFEPQSGAERGGAGAPFVPITGRQYEAGLKFQPPGTGALFNLSVYDLRRRNVPVPDPRAGTTVDGVVFPANSQIQVGEVSIRGIELDGRGEIAPGLTVVVAGTHTDPLVRRGNNPVGTGDQLSGVTGTRPLAVPKWSGSGFLSYDLGEAGVAGALGGFTIGGGVRYVGSSDGTAQFVRDGVTVTQRFKSPDFTLVDAVLGFDLGALTPGLDGLSFTVNASNLFDKRHIASCFFNNSCYYGASRTVVGTVRFDW